MAGDETIRRDERVAGFDYGAGESKQIVHAF
jgi:hypothetical protein